MKPWWLCCEWRSYWCVLDVLQSKLHVNFEWINRGHHRAMIRAWDKAYESGIPVEIVVGPPPVVRDWVDDPDTSFDEKMARFESLRPVATRGPIGTHPGFYVSTGTHTYGSGATVTWNWKQ